MPGEYEDSRYWVLEGDSDTPNLAPGEYAIVDEGLGGWLLKTDNRLYAVEVAALLNDASARGTLAFLQRCLRGGDTPADCDRAMGEGWWEARRVPGADHQYEGEPLCVAAQRLLAETIGAPPRRRKYRFSGADVLARFDGRVFDAELGAIDPGVEICKRGDEIWVTTAADAVSAYFAKHQLTAI